MFDRIKEALNKSASTGSGQFDNIMKFPAGHTYTIRLLPIVEEGKEPLFHHWVNSWTSKSTASFISALSLKTFGERDPITELRWKLFKAWKDANPNAENKEFNGEITEREQWLINAVWIDNPENPELNGTVQILRMGPQLKAIIDAATEGARADELGWEIFDPTAGHDFKIVAAKQGVFTTFKDSTITTKSKTKLTDDDVDKLYEKVHDLTQIYAVKTYDELTTMLNEHFFCDQKAPTGTVAAKKNTVAAKPTTPVVVNEEVDDDIPMFHGTDSDVMNKLLEGLDIPS